MEKEAEVGPTFKKLREMVKKVSGPEVLVLAHLVKLILVEPDVLLFGLVEARGLEVEVVRRARQNFSSRNHFLFKFRVFEFVQLLITFTDSLASNVHLKD